jgi:hypothetical protein
LVQHTERGEQNSRADRSGDHRYGTLYFLLTFHVDEALTAECLQIFTKISTVRESRLGNAHASTAESYQMVASLYRYMRNYTRGKDFAEKATLAFMEAVGEEHPSTKSARKLLEFLQSKINEELSS